MAYDMPPLSVFDGPQKVQRPAAQHFPPPGNAAAVSTSRLRPLAAAWLSLRGVSIANCSVHQAVALRMYRPSASVCVQRNNTIGRGNGCRNSGQCVDATLFISRIHKWWPRYGQQSPHGVPISISGCGCPPGWGRRGRYTPHTHHTQPRSKQREHMQDTTQRDAACPRRHS